MKKYIYYFTLIFAISLTVQTSFAQQLMINELMAKNSSVIQDSDGDYPDWIEIYNPGVSAATLAGYHLTDDRQNLNKWLIPNTAIIGGGHLLIFASGKDRGSPEFHSNFSISSSGESIYLVNPSGLIEDSTASIIIPEDLSYARITDGDPNWIISSTTTPGAANNTTIVPMLSASHQSGVFQDSITFVINSNAQGDIHYTLDGNLPTINSPILTAPLIIKNRSQDSNYYSMIPSSVVFSPPTATIPKINTIRYALFNNGVKITDVINKTFILDLNYSLPIVSIVTDPNNLFSPDSGFYVPGLNPGTGPWFTAANFYQQNNESPAHFEYFDTNSNLVISQNVGIKLHGGITRSYSQKSLKIIARSEYGKGELEYDFFNGKTIDEFDRIILRNGGQDNSRSIIRDAFVSRVAEDLNLVTMHAQPTIVFLNGEYWGIHILREKPDEHHLENLYGIDKDSIDLLQGNADIIEGSNTEYLNMLNYITNNDLSISTNYNIVEDQINIENFIDYFSVEIYYNNREWPHNNIKYYKQQGANHKWNWILFDTDITSGAWSVCKADRDSYIWLSDTAGYPIWSRIMFLKLIENNEFKDQFVNRFADLKNTIFTASNQLSVINGLKNELLPEINGHLERWNHMPTQQDWLNRVGVVEVFINDREDYIWNQTRQFFTLGDTTVNVVLNENIQNAGVIKFSSLNHQNLPWNGQYYKTTTIEVSAIPNFGYQFSHWLETGNINSTINISLSCDTSFTAIYQATSTATTDLVINEIQTSNSNGILDTALQHPDWIELYNKGNTAIDLNQFYLTDNLLMPCKWKIQLSDTSLSNLDPYEFICFYADKDTLEGELHTNFSLSSGGEQVGVYQVIGIDSIPSDTLSFGNRISNVSFGRYPDGANQLRNFTIPTFQAQNQIKLFYDSLYINEILAKNLNDTTDVNGDYEDWIEIYNGGNEQVDLGGYFLSDDINDPTRWKIPIDNNGGMVIDAKSFALFFADNDTEDGENHLPFKLSSAGETINLSFLDDQNILTIDELTFSTQQDDISFGRFPDGDINTVSFINTTPNRTNYLIITSLEENNESGFTFYPNPFSDAIIIENDFKQPTPFKIVSIIGQVIIKGMIKSNKHKIDIDHLSPNIYFLSIDSRTYKIIKQ
tara:strand:+ start:531 stop:3941 length:3411 start_codon:yes stop_codon:yes gene_type:complete